MLGNWIHHNIFCPAAKKRGDDVRPEVLQEAIDLDRAYRAPVPPAWTDTGTRVAFHMLPLQPFIAHWRGQTSLRKALVENVLLACLMVFLVQMGMDSLANPDTYQGEWLRRRIYTFALLVALGGVWVWWGVGAMRFALKNVNGKNSILGGLTVFLLGLLFMIESGLTAVTNGYEWIRSLYDPMDVAEVRFDPQENRIKLDGDIGFGTYLRLQRVIAEHPKATLIELNSPGGFVIEGLALARLVRNSRLDTVVFYECDSACTLIFGAGKQRYIGPNASFGFHRSYVFGKPFLDTWTETDYRMADFLKSQGVQRDFIEIAFSYRGDGLWLPKQGHMLDAGYATLKWTDR